MTQRLSPVEGGHRSGPGVGDPDLGPGDPLSGRDRSSGRGTSCDPARCCGDDRDPQAPGRHAPSNAPPSLPSDAAQPAVESERDITQRQPGPCGAVSEPRAASSRSVGQPLAVPGRPEDRTMPCPGCGGPSGPALGAAPNRGTDDLRADPVQPVDHRGPIAPPLSRPSGPDPCPPGARCWRNLADASGQNAPLSSGFGRGPGCFSSARPPPAAGPSRRARRRRGSVAGGVARLLETRRARRCRPTLQPGDAEVVLSRPGGWSGGLGGARRP